MYFRLQIFEQLNKLKFNLWKIKQLNKKNRDNPLQNFNHNAVSKPYQNILNKNLKKNINFVKTLKKLKETAIRFSALVLTYFLSVKFTKMFSVKPVIPVE